MTHQRASTRQLRYALTLHLQDRPGPATVADLVAAAADAGLCPREPAGKTVADALRTEVARGRVRRAARGVYVAGTVPRTTRRYLHAWLEWSLGGHAGPAPR